MPLQPAITLTSEERAPLETFEVCEATFTKVRRRFSHGGVEAVLHEKVQQLIIAPSSPYQGTSGIVLASLLW